MATKAEMAGKAKSLQQGRQGRSSHYRMEGRKGEKKKIQGREGRTSHYSQESREGPSIQILKAWRAQQLQEEK